MESVRLEHFGFTYPGCSQPALEDVNLSVESGGFYVLCGRSGCGKTTLLRSLKREIAPHGKVQGRVWVEGRPQGEGSLAESAQAVGYVMQNPENQVVTDTVWHELAFGLENLGTPTAIIRRRVAETAHFFGLNAYFERPVSTLSGGQKQILNLAAILTLQPRTVVLDEPTSQLDPIAAKEFLQVLRRIQVELGITVVLSEHRLEEVFPLADQVVYLEHGQVAFQGPPRDFAAWVAREGRTDFQDALPAAARLACALQAPPPYPLSVREGRDFVAARTWSLGPQAIAHALSSQPPLLTAKDLWFRYRREDDFVLRGFTLAVRPGQIHCLVGGNGSGKSTALAALTGVLRPSRGHVRRAEDARVAMLAQNPQTLFVCDTLGEDLMEHAAETGYTQADAEALAGRLGLAAYWQRHPYDLSGGEMQKAALAKLLLRRPNVLLLDEPTKGIDAFAKEELAGIFRGLAAQGAAIVLVTHDLEFAARHADLCSMLFGGEVLCSDGGRDFFLGNHFYTTAINRMTRGLLPDCVVVEDVLRHVKDAQSA